MLPIKSILKVDINTDSASNTDCTIELPFILHLNSKDITMPVSFFYNSIRSYKSDLFYERR